jgi:hypothetical protein
VAVLKPHLLVASEGHLEEVLYKVLKLTSAFTNYTVTRGRANF